MRVYNRTRRTDIHPSGNAMTRLAGLTSQGLVLVLVWTSAAYAAAPAPKCEASKLKESSKYSACRLKAESKSVLKGTAPIFFKCESKFTDRFNRAEARAGVGICPSEGDEVEINARITAFTADIATLLAGGALPGCGNGVVDSGEQCDGADLAGADCSTLGFAGGTLACLAACAFDQTGCTLAGPVLPQTGQSTCYSNAGAIIACSGSGQDGEVQSGRARAFVNNGDGTISDNATGLTWEVHCNGPSCPPVHAQDTLYTWGQAFSLHVATLNTTNFAGHGDWRVPNATELQSLANYERSFPAAYAEFDSCASDCDVTTCSCTASSNYWTSSTFADDPTLAWAINFFVGVVGSGDKAGGFRVRAVRGGL